LQILELNKNFQMNDSCGEPVKQTKYRTIVLSDIHLGSKHSRVHEVLAFLSAFSCKRLILNGDIIDGWQLKKTQKYWSDSNTQFIKKVISKIVKENTEVIYVRGNHDDFLDKIVPFAFPNMQVVKDYVLVSNDKRYFVLHGDIFDNVTVNMRWLAMIGDVGYNFLLNLNRIYNYFRMRRGKPYFSLAQHMKQKVKSAVSYISDFEKELVKLTRHRHCQGIICGHIHSPANCHYGEIHYLNSGDWVESLTALVEDESGNWSVLKYSENIA
jgi:UDP-2,3-diacylglucosamine pyrophosphatase LpxH